MWTYSCKTDCTEVVARVERMSGTLAKESTPLPVDETHPEQDDSPTLGLNDHHKFQMLLGMLQ